MPKKLVKKIVKQTFELPGQVTKKAAEQIGVIPGGEPEPELAEEGLEKKRKKDEAMRRRRLAEIKAEIKQVVEERKAAIAKTQKEQKRKKEEAEPKIKPLKEPKAKRPRGFLAGLRQKWKSRAELVGRRVSG